MYSKSSDQLGPLSGYISPSPRISHPTGAGRSRALSSVATTSAPRLTDATSQTGHSCT